jgi:hypothetical protein
LENPHFFAHRQCRLEQAKEKVLEKFKDLGREDLEKILNFVLHILKTTRNVMDFTEMIAENDEVTFCFLLFEKTFDNMQHPFCCWKLLQPPLSEGKKLFRVLALRHLSASQNLTCRKGIRKERCELNKFFF